MSEDAAFEKLIQRVRARDEAAATELVLQYTPEIRRIARIRLNDARLKQLVESSDICQSVLANFFFRVASGQFDLQTPEQLLKLLATMTCNRVIDQARRERAMRRNEPRRVADSSAALETTADSGSNPSVVVANAELIQVVRQHLTPEELYVTDQRGLGREWADLAGELGGTAESLRKKLGRAMDRVARKLGLDEVHDD
jgi:ECF sigma factor